MTTNAPPAEQYPAQGQQPLPPHGQYAPQSAPETPSMGRGTIDRRGYTAERGYYIQHPENGSCFVVEKERPVWTPCLWLLVVIFIIFVLALLIVLIIFFTWGQLNTRTVYVNATATRFH